MTEHLPEKTLGEIYWESFAPLTGPGAGWRSLDAETRSGIEAAVETVVAHVVGTMAQPVAEPKRYALVEQMGYRHDIAAVREVTFAGQQMIELTRLDDPAAVRLISPGSLYGITWLTEDEARSRAKPWTAAAIGSGHGQPYEDDEPVPDDSNEPARQAAASALVDAGHDPVNVSRVTGLEICRVLEHPANTDQDN